MEMHDVITGCNGVVELGFEEEGGGGLQEVTHVGFLTTQFEFLKYLLDYLWDGEDRGNNKFNNKV